MAVAARIDASGLTLAGLELNAGFRIDYRHLRNGLREWDVDRLPLTQAQVEIVRHLGLFVDACVQALQTSGAEVLVDVPGVAQYGHLVVTDVTLHLRDFRVCPERDVRVAADRGHLGGEDARGAVQRGKGLVESGHVAADGRLPLHEEHMLARVCQGQRSVDPGDAAAKNQGIGVDGHPAALERLMKGDPPYGSAYQVLGLTRSLRLVFVNPGSLLPDIDHVEEEGIQAADFQGGPKRVFVEMRGAGGHDDAVQLVLADVLPDQVLAGIGAHVLVVARYHDIRQGGCEYREGLHVHGRGDVGAAVAGVDADTNRAAPVRHRLPSPRQSWGTTVRSFCVPIWPAGALATRSRRPGPIRGSG